MERKDQGKNMKLKTLKDIEKEKINKFETKDMHQPGGGLSDKTQREFFRSGYKTSFEYAFKESKQEAIKWIKELSEPDHEFMKEHSLTIDEIIFGNYEELQKVKLWIKHFFNIKEEELK